MCGVVGVVGKGAEELASRGLDHILYRGIRSRVDSYGLDAAIGHVRLPIVGVGEENDQPVEAGRWRVAFVGELLDFHRYRPGDECDVGLVAETWRDRGPDGFYEFDGFWSIVAWDTQSRSMHALVDYLAQKPLYYRCTGDTSIVASELRGVVHAAPVSLDWVYLSAVIKWGYCPETWRTPYEGVFRLSPGEHLVFKGSGIVSLRRADGVRSLRGSPADLRRAIEEAVRPRVSSSDVPVACLVSGGLDSTVVWRLGSNYGDLVAYVGKGGLGDSDETEWAASVAGSPKVLSWSGVDRRVAMNYLQEPIDLGSLVPQVSLSEGIAREGGERVCLTGDGADELFGGYGRATRYDSQASDIWHELVAWHLPRLDTVMMRNRIEVRSPFLSRRVLGYALGLPRESRVGKRVLREIFSDIVPASIGLRPKTPLRTASVVDEGESGRILRVREFIEEVTRCQKLES